MKKLLLIALTLFLFSCKKNSEDIINNDLKIQIDASIKEVKANLEEFTALKKEGKISSNFKSTSDQLFEFIENKQKASNFPMSFDKPASIFNRSVQISSKAEFSTAQTSSDFDFSQFYYVPRTDIGSNLENFITTYEAELDHLAVNASVEDLTEQQLTDSLTEITNGIKDEIAETTTLSNEENQILLGVFDGVETLTPSIVNYFHLDGVTSNFSFNELETFSRRCGFFCKTGRAVLRVAVAVVAVAVVAVVPVAVIAIAKKASFILAYKTFMLKGYSIGTIMGIPAKLKAGLIGGLYFGVKAAEKGWDKDWKGWPNEFTLGFYVKNES